LPHLNVDFKVAGRGVLGVVGDLVEAARGREDNDAGGRTLVQLEFVVTRVGAEDGSASSPEALAVTVGLLELVS